MRSVSNNKYENNNFTGNTFNNENRVGDWDIHCSESCPLMGRLIQSIIYGTSFLEKNATKIIHRRSIPYSQFFSIPEL